MSISTMSMSELRGSSLEELFTRVVREQVLLKVRLADGQVITIQPEPKLTPLPILEGSVPDNWKDAIYE